MRRLLLSAGLLATLIAPTALSAPPGGRQDAPSFDSHQTLLRDVLSRSDFRPSQKALDLAAKEGRAFDRDAPFMKPIAAVGDPIKVVGEVAVLEGDSSVVTDFGNGDFGLRYDNAVQDPMAVTERFIKQFGDEYDFVAVWTAFWDNGADGLAYYVPIYNDVSGIGDNKYNQRQYWGVSNAGRLQGFLNMKSIDVYGNIAREDNYVYPVIGQEFSHRWLAQMSFKRANGQVSDATLGRDQAHWSTLLQADASVQDGNEWRDNGDGTFTLLDTMSRYSDLDLYGMGLMPPAEVEPFFLIENAVYRGQSYNGLTTWPQGVKINGDRTDISIDDIIAANGARKPGFADTQKDFRMAFVLVTAPGQTASDVADQIATIETFRAIWEKKYSEWTGGRSTMCTRVTAQCDRPALKITKQSVRELEGDGDEMAEPGEKVAVSVTLSNNGGGTAAEPRIHLNVPEGIGLTVEQTPVILDDLPAGESVTLETAFVIDVGADAVCGQDFKLKLEAATGELLTETEVVVPMGYRFLFYDDFSTDRGWKINADGSDTAGNGAWERDTPNEVSANGAFTTQPGSNVNGATDGKVFVTGARRGNGLGAYDVDDGVTSVTSPAIPVGEAFDPRVSYFTWRTGLDFNTDPQNVLADDNDPLTVAMSPDDGATWITLEQDISNEFAWLKKDFRVLDFVETLPATIKLRFSIVDAEPQSLTEAAFDQVRVWDLQDSCFDKPIEDPTDPTDPTDPDPTDPITPVKGRSSGGCDGGGAEGLIALGAAAALLARRRRTR